MESTVIIGRNPVLEYLQKKGDKQGYHLFISLGAHGKIIDVIEQAARSAGVPVEKKDKDYFAKIGNARHQGVLLEITGAAGSSSEISPDELLTRVAEKKGVIVLLDNITDPQNTGAIIRTAEALGADAVCWPKSNSAGLTPATIKSSAGATAHIAVLPLSNAGSFLEAAKKKGFWVIGTTGTGDRQPFEIRDIRPAVVVIGSEGDGMRRLTGDKCDFLVRIPLTGKIASLNASVAAGIILYELLVKETANRK